MKILIIEDELPAAKRLKKLILEYHPEAEIIEVLDSVELAVNHFNTKASPDLVFMDIQLADGLSFDIFNQTEVSSPVIFTTAFDQYALKAFKVNSIDYLLKPIEINDLGKAFKKFEKHFQPPPTLYSKETIQVLMDQMTNKQYKERFLVKAGQQLIYINITDIAYFYSEDGMVHVLEQNNKRHILDYTLDQLEAILRPNDFFRINRKFIVSLTSIVKIHTYLNSRLQLELQPISKTDVIVSRDRVNDFKQWLDR